MRYKIAYGNNSLNRRLQNLTAYVTMGGNALCSTTPVYYDAKQ